MAERHGTIIEFPRGKHVGHRVCDLAKEEHFYRCPAADGWIAATLARCPTMKDHYRIRPTIGANKI
jgi:hypothetical protein